MKKFILSLMVLGISPALAGTAAVKGIRLNIPSLVLFTADDVSKLEAALAGKEEKMLELSEGRAAKCGGGACQLEGKGYKASLKKTEVEKFAVNLRKAQRESREISTQEGEITTRCNPERCALDLSIENTRARTVNVKAKPRNTFTGDLISALIDGVLKGLAQ